MAPRTLGRRSPEDDRRPSTHRPPDLAGPTLRLAVDPGLRSHLPTMARGRVLVLDFFASRRCGVTIGDLTVRLRSAAPADHIELATVEGVRVFADARLLDLLGEAGPTLRLAGLPFARHIGIELARPECWIDFLDGPGAFLS